LKIRTSELDGKTIVIEIEKDDEGPVVKMLATRGHGYAVFGPDIIVPMAVIDGRIREELWCTENHMLAVEAHEIGHISTNSTDEPTAERAAISLLEANKFFPAAQLLKERGVI
jgi:hypothetical protein